MLNIVDIFDNLYEKDGIWQVKTELSGSPLSYPDHGNDLCFQLEDNSFWFNHRNNIIYWAVNKFTTSSGVFLDIGGGNGFVSKYLQTGGKVTLMLEPGIKGCINARKRGVKNIINASIDQLNPTSSKIQSIGLFDVVEHIENDLSFLKSCHKLLDDNGLMFITVPAFNFLWSQEDIDAGHYRRYSLIQLKEVVEDAGFKIKYSSYFFSFLILPVFLLRTIPSFFFKVQTLKTESEHHFNSTFSQSIIDYCSSIELKMINKGKSLFFGTSCILVAEKANP